MGGEMILVLHRLKRPTTTLALLVVLVFAIAPAALGDEWAGDQSATDARVGLDPAIRTAIDVRSSSLPAVQAAVPAAAVSTGDDGFAWRDALVGAAIGIVGTCAALICVNLVRSHGQLRSA
jgi:hypothetical protein